MKHLLGCRLPNSRRATARGGCSLWAHEYRYSILRGGEGIPLEARLGFATTIAPLGRSSHLVRGLSAPAGFSNRKVHCDRTGMLRCGPRGLRHASAAETSSRREPGRGAVWMEEEPCAIDVHAVSPRLTRGSARRGAALDGPPRQGIRRHRRVRQGPGGSVACRDRRRLLALLAARRCHLMAPMQRVPEDGVR